MVTTFREDESGYAAWLQRNPIGFVINSNPTPSPSYLKLHRATCYSIGGTPSRGRRWTVAYMKVCGNNVEELDRWAEREAGAHPDRCPHCLP
jgi:hypothetical protein